MLVPSVFATTVLGMRGWHLILATTLLRAVSKETCDGILLDLSHGYRNQTTCRSPTDRFETFGKKTGTGPNGWYSTESFSMSEHCGTHLDAPYHFNRDGWKLDEIPLERLVVEGVHLNVSQEVDGNGSFLLTSDHLVAWERINGPMPNGSVILVNFGWAHMFDDRQQYYHSDSGSRTTLRFPGLSVDAARWIADSGKAYGLGVDGPSVDAGGTASSDVHRTLSKAGMYNLENVALNGTTLPPAGFKLYVQPIKIVGGTGGPCRILAVSDDALSES